MDVLVVSSEGQQEQKKQDKFSSEMEHNLICSLKGGKGKNQSPTNSWGGGSIDNVLALRACVSAV